MGWTVSGIKWIMLVSGALPCTRADAVLDSRAVRLFVAHGLSSRRLPEGGGR